jgi:hypothetical protein
MPGAPFVYRLTDYRAHSARITEFRIQQEARLGHEIPFAWERGAMLAILPTSEEAAFWALTFDGCFDNQTG